MRESLVALELVLSELGVPAEIGDLRDRKLVQKAVYVAQAVGVDLGYGYGWYVYGPYSPALTRDYFALDEALQTEGSSLEDWTLQRRLAERLKPARGVLTVPEGVSLDQSQWAELVASLLFLTRERGLDLQAAREVIDRKKPGLKLYVDLAWGALSAAGI